MPSKLTTEKFIEKANKKHNNKYDYSYVNYNDCNTIVVIKCKIHGFFEQKATNHLSGHGCPNCGKLICQYGSKKNNKTTEWFINEAKKIHGDKYDYSLVQYINKLKPVQIICSKHGIITQRPDNHLKTFGCGKCGHEHRGK